ERYGQPTWFGLGDRDLATHIVRTARLRAGERLTDITGGLVRALGVTAVLLPMTDERVATQVRTTDGWLDFQDYFVRRGHRDEVAEVRFTGAEAARPTPEALAALATAGLVVIAPSNPFVSVAPILAVPGMLAAAAGSAAPVVAVSPLVGGAALRGPADRLLRSLGHDRGAAGVARHYASRYAGLIDAFVIDDADAAEAGAVAATGISPLVAPAYLRSEDERRRLARQILEAAGVG
ncbi:MAG TPA: 2-phospho-L-lactate transferase CofD family protein, partial [Candidatus Limnocylindria bacterium]|nr:2-phospho-L-lactate transferase CofD family protein [Candidatus Limnocylindria bacterium]